MEATNWLAETEELKEVLAKRDHLVVREPPPPPPKLPPRQDLVDQVAAKLLSSGLWGTARDAATGENYFYECKSKHTTWNLHAYVETNFDRLADLITPTKTPPGRVPQTEKHSTKSKPRTADPKKGAQDEVNVSQTELAQPSARRKVPTPTPSKDPWREKVCAIYLKHNPSKLSLVDELLRRYANREEELWRNLMAKYPPSPEQQEVSPRKQLFEQEAEKDPSAGDAFMHEHHGETHAVSYHSPTNAQQAANTKKSPRGAPQARVPSRSPGKKPVSSPGKSLAIATRSTTPKKPTAAPSADPDLESPARATRTGKARAPRPVEHELPTPELSAIDEQSQPEEITNAVLLQAAREAAEKKARQVLATAAPRVATPSPSRVRNGTAHAAAPVSPRRSSAWEQEFHQREDAIAMRREFLKAQRLNEKMKRDELLRRRATELQKIRDQEQTWKRNRDSRSTTPTPRRETHVDPTQNATGKENVVGLAQKRFERALSAAAATVSPPPTATFDPTSKVFADRWQKNNIICKKPTTTSPSPSRKLSTNEMKKSAERLSKHYSRQTTA